jgi:hypothetical protein
LKKAALRIHITSFCMDGRVADDKPSNVEVGLARRD